MMNEKEFDEMVKMMELEKKKEEDTWTKFSKYIIALLDCLENLHYRDTDGVTIYTYEHISEEYDILLKELLEEGYIMFKDEYSRGNFSSNTKFIAQLTILFQRIITGVHNENIAYCIRKISKNTTRVHKDSVLKALGSTRVSEKFDDEFD